MVWATVVRLAFMIDQSIRTYLFITIQYRNQNIGCIVVCAVRGVVCV